MAYTPTIYVNDNPPALNAENLNHAEQGILNNDVAITGINTTLNDMGFNVDKNMGVITSAGKWTNINGSNYHIVINVKPGQKVYIQAQAKTDYYAVLKTYSTPVSGVVLDFSDSISGRQTIVSSGYASFTVPADAHYLVVVVTNNANDISPVKLTVDSYDFIKNMLSNVQDLFKLSDEKDVNLSLALDKVQMFGNTGNSLYIIGGAIGYRFGSTGSITASVYGAITNKFTALQDLVIYAKTYNYTIERKVIYSGETVSSVEYIGSNICYVSKGQTVALSLYGLLDSEDVRFEFTSIDQIYETIIYPEGGLYSTISRTDMKKWIAFGDSITQGVFSEFVEGVAESHTDPNVSYAMTVKQLNGYILDNQGIGGSGWVIPGTNVPKNIRDLIDEKTGGVYNIDFTKYDICTILLGVNDWKSALPFGTFDDDIETGGTVYSNMRYVIEQILERNPNIKLILISPINCAFSISTNPSTAANNWGIGYEVNGKTLKDMFNIEKEVCEYYDVEFIDMLDKSVVGRNNIQTALPDTVHPSIYIHQQIGRQLSKYF